MGGKPSCSMVGIWVGMARNAAPMPVSLRNTLTRKRPPSADTYEKSMSLPSRSCFLLARSQHLGDVAFELRLTQVAKLDGHQIPVHAQHRRHADGQMQIGATLGHAQLEERVDSCHNVQGYP